MFMTSLPPSWIANGLLAVATAVLAARSRSSAAFERPLHLSILALVFVVIGLFAAEQRQRRRSSGPAEGTDRDAGALPPPSPSPGLLRRITAPPLLVPWLCIVARTLIFWYSIRTPQCTSPGLHALLPLLLALLSFLEARIPGLDTTHRHNDGDSTSGAIRYAVVAFIWALAVAATSRAVARPTNAICPSGLWTENLVPLFQLVGAALDAIILTRIARLCSSAESRSAARTMLSSLMIGSAIAVALVAAPALKDREVILWCFALDINSVRQIVIDAAVLAVAFLAGLHLLLAGLASPATVVINIISAAFLAYLELRTIDGILIQAWTRVPGLLAGLAAFLGAGMLLHGDDAGHRHSLASLRQATLHGRFFHAALAIFIFMLAQVLLLGPTRSNANLPDTIAAAQQQSDAWIKAAGNSTNLREAVTAYHERYGIPPPPNFGKWYQFARSVDSPIIDTFDQIDSDLMPFWSLKPSSIRMAAAHLIEQPGLAYAALVIKDGSIDFAGVPGQHRWLMDFVKSLLEPNAEWLPNVQIPINLDEECRIAIPYESLQLAREAAQEPRRILREGSIRVSFSEEPRDPRKYWHQDVLSAETKEGPPPSPFFSDWTRTAIYSRWIAPTCPSGSPAHSVHWWDAGELCLACTAPHMMTEQGPADFVSDWTLSGDLCHQPDLAHLHGFLQAPGNLRPSQLLFPVFSPSRVSGFNDILFPGPWDLATNATRDGDERTSSSGALVAGDTITGAGPNTAWDKKMNSVYWRGRYSDGHATSGSWQSSLRPRFAHMASRIGTLLIPARLRDDGDNSGLGGTPDSDPVSDAVPVDVSFVGEFRERCDPRDREALRDTFYAGRDGVNASGPPVEDFDEHWRHRHLVDLDGSAPSGGFPSFVASASLPYRARIFRTWWEERIHAWRHFVPVDTRLSELWRLVAYFAGPGSEDGRELARAGRDWGRRVLRRQDMEVYMFRLVLEYGRVVDDNRERVGYTYRGVDEFGVVVPDEEDPIPDDE